MANPARSGPEFLVNTTTANEQSSSAVAGLANGRFVVTWQDLSQTAPDTSGYATRAQIFNADGSKSGVEFVVNTTTTTFQLDPDITALSDGGFVVVWNDFNLGGGDTSAGSVKGQRYAADGSPVGGEFLVNTATLNGQNEAAVTALENGRFVVAWTDQSVAAPDGDIRAQIFNTNGTKSGVELHVNASLGGSQFWPDIAGLKNGGFVVAWTDTQTQIDDNSDFAVRMQIHDSQGALVGGEVLVNTTTFGVQSRPAITGLNNGRFVVTWSDKSQTSADNFNEAIFGQIFNADGSRHGGEFLVNTSIAFAQDRSTITALADGRFVVAWWDESNAAGDTSGTAIRAQVFNANGTTFGTEFVVPTITLGAQFEPSVDAMADGRFVVTWTDFSLTDPDRSGFAIRGQIFDARTAAIALTGTTGDDDYLGTKFADSLKGGSGNDQLAGALGNDTILGGAGADTLLGGGGADSLRGGTGADVLTGNGGADTFVFASAAEAGNGPKRDMILDFTSGSDKIDLSAFMAGGSFIGTTAFHATGAAEVRFAAASQILQGDVDGNGSIDFSIQLATTTISAADFIF